MIPVHAFFDELVKIAGGGEYISFFTGEKRTDATFFPPGTMNKPAKDVAKVGLKKKYAPGGPASSIRWITYYINRAGKNLPAKRRKELEKARSLLHEKLKTNARSNEGP